MDKVWDFLFKVWMIVGVIGFPISVGYLLFRWQKYAKAEKDHEKVKQQEKLRRAKVIAAICLLVLVGFIAYSIMVFGSGGTQ